MAYVPSSFHLHRELFYFYCRNFVAFQPTMPSFGGVIERTIVLTSMSGMVVFKLNHPADFTKKYVDASTTLFNPRFPVLYGSREQWRRIVLRSILSLYTVSTLIQALRMMTLVL